MAWRQGRRFFGTDPCTEPGYAVVNSTNAPCVEDPAFRNFIVAFEGLVGKEGTVSGIEMQQFADFMLQVQLPPNPVRNLDNSLTTSQQNGEDKWFSCGPGAAECVVVDPNATDTVEEDINGRITLIDRTRASLSMGTTPARTRLRRIPMATGSMISSK